jgi:hypothetical protein
MMSAHQSGVSFLIATSPNTLTVFVQSRVIISSLRSLR